MIQFHLQLFLLNHICILHHHSTSCQALLIQEEQKGEETALSGLESLNLSGRRALLVEDNDLNAEIAAEILRMSGLEVDRAEDGEEAVDRMAECADGYYDIVFMDIQMPRLNGYDATRAIRAMDRPDAKAIPIVAMTANAFDEDRRAAMEAGMDDHVAKPIDTRLMWNALRRLLK